MRFQKGVNIFFLYWWCQGKSGMLSLILHISLTNGESYTCSCVTAKLVQLCVACRKGPLYFEQMWEINQRKTNQSRWSFKHSLSKRPSKKAVVLFSFLLICEWGWGGGGYLASVCNFWRLANFRDKFHILFSTERQKRRKPAILHCQ